MIVNCQLMACSKAIRKNITDFVSYFDTRGHFPIAIMVSLAPANLPIDLAQGFKGLVPNGDGDDAYLGQGTLFVLTEVDTNNANDYRELVYRIPFPRNMYERDFVIKYHHHRHQTIPFRTIHWEFGAPDVLMRWKYRLPYSDCDSPPDRWGRSRGMCPFLTYKDAGTTWDDQFGVTRIFDFRLLDKLLKFNKPSEIYEAYDNYLTYGSHMVAVPNRLWKQVINAAPISVFTLDGEEYLINDWVNARTGSDLKRMLVTAYQDEFGVADAFAEAEAAAATAEEAAAAEAADAIEAITAAAATTKAAAKAAAAAAAVEAAICEFKMFPYLDKEAKAMKTMIQAKAGIFGFNDMLRLMIFRAFRKPGKNMRFDLYFKDVEN